jgi:FtsH-binding integral membrane protein
LFCEHPLFRPRSENADSDPHSLDRIEDRSEWSSVDPLSCTHRTLLFDELMLVGSAAFTKRGALSQREEHAYLSRMNYDSRGQWQRRSPVAGPVTARPVGEGLVSDALWTTYRWMSAGLGVTGLVALFVAATPSVAEVVLGNRLVFYLLLFAQLGLVFAFTPVAARAKTGTVAAMFFTYAAVTGATLSVIFFAYTMASIASVFFVTAGAFAGLSVVGLVIKRDLSPIGRFATFALIGLILASLVNLFIASSALSFLVSIVGVLLFAALTAYDTQKLKQMFASGEVHANMPLVGALTLYLDFINMFLFLLRLFGRRRD